MNTEEIDRLQNQFDILDQDGNGEIDSEELEELVSKLGLELNQQQLREMIQQVDTDNSGTISFDEFKTLMISSRGDYFSRLQLAFSIFDENKDGKIGADELLPVMSQFGLSKSELDELIAEIDIDGSGAIDFDEFCRLLPKDAERSLSHVIPAPQVRIENVKKRKTKRERSRDFLRSQFTRNPKTSLTGTSILQIQIGLFRMIQSSAYRCFRESYSANYETHVRAKSLPYCFPDFVEFVRTAVELYKSLGYVNEVCNPILDELVNSLEKEYERLMYRIQNWDNIEKEPEMLIEMINMQDSQKKKDNLKQKFLAGVEFAISMKRKKITLANVFEGVLAIEELNSLRRDELFEEDLRLEALDDDESQDYLKKWNKVIIKDAFETIDGAMIPVSYWYEDFMPKLLAAFSITNKKDIPDNISPNVKKLDEWFAKSKKAKQFDKFGIDIIEEFENCTPKQKLMLQQGWRLSRHYLNGVQKRRERVGVGREDGNLCNYVAFIDVFVKRSTIKKAMMRVSFPYYLGPPVWRFFHTTAEVVCSKPMDMQKACIPVFAMFFKYFAKMYACPYCRHHLNTAVIQNKEIDMYPIEYIILGKHEEQKDLNIPMDAKLSTVVDGRSMRIFFWKLHNTVNSSIERTEEWYHKVDRPFYTSRYWPSLDSEITKLTTLNQTEMAVEDVRKMYSLLKPCALLTGLRNELQQIILGNKLEDHLGNICVRTNRVVKELEKIVEESGFLQRAYTFDPNIVNDDPVFSPEEERFARSGFFVLD